MHGVEIMASLAGALPLYSAQPKCHFRAGFQGLVQEIITVDSVGLSTADINSFPRDHLRSTL